MGLPMWQAVSIAIHTRLASSVPCSVRLVGCEVDSLTSRRSYWQRWRLAFWRAIWGEAKMSQVQNSPSWGNQSERTTQNDETAAKDHKTEWPQEKGRSSLCRWHWPQVVKMNESFRANRILKFWWWHYIWSATGLASSDDVGDR